MKKILVVEDEGDLRELMVKALKDSGYEAVPCDNGRDVLPLLREIKPDLILLDIMLPGVDGLALARQLAEDPVFSRTPLMAVSALETSKKTIEQLPQSCGFVSKPFPMSYLLSKIKAVLGQN